MKKTTSSLEQPVSMIVINRLLVALVIVLAFVAGYFHAKIRVLEEKSNLLEKPPVAQ